MGKSSRKMNKKINRQQVKAENKEMIALQTKLAQQYEAMDYDGALETIAELMGKKCYEPEIMFKAAQIFFLQGDYKRSASWVTNTLQYNSGHVDARLLLARICLLEDRNDDAMAIYDVILQRGASSLTPEQQDDIKEATDYIVRTDGAWLQDNYPLVANLVMETGRNEKAMKPQEMQESVVSAAVETDKVMTDIMQSPVSLREKIAMLNAYAGGCFVASDYEGAMKFLQKAEELDAHDNMTLRNLAMLAKEMGQQEKALAYAGRMNGTDFVLLKQLL